MRRAWKASSVVRRSRQKKCLNVSEEVLTFFCPCMSNAKLSAPEGRLRLLALSQSGFYAIVNLWALLFTAQFLSLTNPGGNVFETRRFALLALILAAYIGIAVARKAELRPAIYVGVAAAAGIALLELLHLPWIGMLSLLWLDLAAQVVLLAGYGMFLLDDLRVRRNINHPMHTETVSEHAKNIAPELLFELHGDRAALPELREKAA